MSVVPQPPPSHLHAFNLSTLTPSPPLLNANAPTMASHVRPGTYSQVFLSLSCSGNGGPSAWPKVCFSWPDLCHTRKGGSHRRNVNFGVIPEHTHQEWSLGMHSLEECSLRIYPEFALTLNPEKSFSREFSGTSRKNPHTPCHT